MSLQLRAFKRKIRLLYRFSIRAFAGQPNVQNSGDKSFGCSQLNDHPVIYSMPVNTIFSSLSVWSNHRGAAVRVDILDPSILNTDNWNWTVNGTLSLVHNTAHDKTDTLPVPVQNSHLCNNSSSNRSPTLQKKVKKDYLPRLLDSIENDCGPVFTKYQIFSDTELSTPMCGDMISAHASVVDREHVIARDIVPVCHNTRWQHSYIDYHNHSRHYEGQVSTDMTMFRPTEVKCTAPNPTINRDRKTDRQLETTKGPSQEQLFKVQEYLIDLAPKFFIPRNHDHDVMISPNIVFENNYYGQNKVVRGIKAYTWAMSKVRWACYLRYLKVKFKIIKLTVHPEDGTIRMRWRIEGTNQMNLIFKLSKYLPWSESRGAHDEWTDAFSIFRVDEKGMIYNHRVERVMPDEEVAKTKVITKLGLAVN